mmetsp:Transcript_55552/g.140796  ORF Transcript_55552/g.140796 Transcript_55552/m.140796 type:complete len:258 (-) Transcript_55552:58-831(-)|eukprot:CAMPEP_0183402868 /NCGR_PEP_ID=MMETSP0370-20130417/14197_1 /TAXON_ID=268820 /ORGANISM="Peridinium aciculiferum, Strain PAER-2" /LENGTH=257 /DNA_ID=CAMNT_0025584531 /DNA_START=110 /DNA_END=883 /DNA_ORIENTATION=+
MAVAIDRGQCCLCLPMQLGVGLIAMIAFANACLCAVALLTQDIRLQPNGYDQRMSRVPSVVGFFGLAFGFVGLLGTYDNKPSWLRAFSTFLKAKLVAMVVVMAADFWMLLQCEGWLKTQPYGHNTAMDVIAENGVCHYARCAFLIGCGLDLGVWSYFTAKVLSYTAQIETSISFPIDFGIEGSGSQTVRWKMYQVKDPTSEMDRAAQIRKQFLDGKRKAKEQAEAERTGLLSANRPTAYGSAAPNFGPDGMPADSKA